MRRRPFLLIVEDDPALRDLYRFTFSVDFAVHACQDGLEALGYIETEHPDVIVLDLDLPRVPGTVVYDELRAHPRTRDVPIIVVTGVEVLPYLPRSTILRKPCRPDQIALAVEHALRQRNRPCLFVRGGQSVWVERLDGPGVSLRLHVYGPGRAQATHRDSDSVASLRRLARLTRTLLAEGYEPVEGGKSPDRRRHPDRRVKARGDDRRRSVR
jgi:DNA-binding response OmpR family regulator